MVSPRSFMTSRAPRRERLFRFRQATKRFITGGRSSFTAPGIPTLRPADKPQSRGRRIPGRCTMDNRTPRRTTAPVFARPANRLILGGCLRPDPDQVPSRRKETTTTTVGQRKGGPRAFLAAFRSESTLAGKVSNCFCIAVIWINMLTNSLVDTPRG
jgi:hypothetical protein